MVKRIRVQQNGRAGYDLYFEMDRKFVEKCKENGLRFSRKPNPHWYGSNPLDTYRTLLFAAEFMDYRIFDCSNLNFVNEKSKNPEKILDMPLPVVHFLGDVYHWPRIMCSIKNLKLVEDFVVKERNFFKPKIGYILKVRERCGVD